MGQEKEAGCRIPICPAMGPLGGEGQLELGTVPGPMLPAEVRGLEGRWAGGPLSNRMLLAHGFGTWLAVSSRSQIPCPSGDTEKHFLPPGHFHVQFAGLGFGGSLV